MKRRNSLVFCFWLTLNGLILTALLTTSGFHFWREYNHLKDALKNEGITAANTLNSAIGLYMLQENYSEISPLTYSLQSEPNIAYVIVKDSNGITVNQKGETTTEKAVIIEKVPIQYFHKTVGEIEIALKTDELNQQINYLLRDTLLSVILFSLVSIILSYYISKKLSLPIRHLIIASQQFAQEKRQVTVFEKSNINEMNQLATAFNQMSATIENHEKILVNEIQKATKALSEKVATLEVLRNISNSVLEVHMHSNDVIKISLQSIQNYMHTPHISYAFHDKSNWHIVHLNDDNILTPFLPKQRILSAANTHVKDIMIRNLDAPLSQYEQTLVQNGMKSLAILPVIAKNNVIGTLNMASTIEDYFSTKVIEQLHLFTNQIALALDRIVAYETLHHSANYDFLTGLPNYRLFKKRITDTLKKGQDKLAAVLFIDLDRFKMVNDTFGHATGDLLLKHVSQTLLHCISTQDMASRFGGDEFAILLTNMKSYDDAIVVAQSILHHLEQPFIIKGYEIKISASIGIAFYPDDGVDAGTLLKYSDRAMYRVKNTEKNNFAVYAQNKDNYKEGNLILENDIRKGLERNEFIVYYQPKINLQTKTISGVEALVRWIHPTKGFISPGEFIPLAEETELIIAIGDFVLREAAKQCVLWQQTKGVTIPISVNLSVRQFFQQTLIQNIENILQETSLDPTLLELEITESMSMDIERSLEILLNLKKLGIQISVDDFGTGYSSLNYLRQLPIDRVKIDKSFIDEMTVNENSGAIVTSIITMSHNLKLLVIAEGVETEEQVTYLHQHHCDEIQGYYFSKPLPTHEFEKRFIDDLTLKIN